MKRKTAITLFLVLQMFTCIVYAQSDTITVELKNVSIEKALNTIEETTGYYFLYNSKLVNVDRMVDLTVNQASIQQTLNILFRGSEIEYTIKSKQIILSNKNDPATKTTTYKVITGIIRDRYREPIIGANITVTGTDDGTVSEEDGRFSLIAPIGEYLKISFIGYETQTVLIRNESPLSIVLDENLLALRDVVVIGYGTQRADEITSAVTRIKAPNFNKVPATYPAQLIKGRVAGLTVMQYNNDPNLTPSMQIRGVSSIKGNNQPLIVIDGIPGDMRSLNAVPPEEIEAMDILKDGSAAAIYGTRGSNGVIIVSTKRPQDGDFRVEYSGYLSTEKVVHKPDILSIDEYIAYGNQTGNKIIKDFGGRDDTYKQLLQENNISQGHNLSVTGSSNQMSYRASINYRKNEGIALKSNRNTYSGSMQLDHHTLQDRLHLSFNLSNTFTSADYLDEKEDYYAFFQAIRQNPTLPVYNKDGTFFETYSGYEDYNPVAYLHQQDRQAEFKNMMGSFNAMYQFTSEIQAKVFLAFERDEDYLNFYRSKLAYRSIKNGDGGEAYKKYLRNINRILELTTEYTHTIPMHSLTVLGGYSYQDFDNEWFEARNNGFITDEFQSHNIGAGSYLKEGKASMQSEKKNSRLIAFFARANYSYDGKYLLSATIRQEGSSKFGNNNKWALFPSVGIGWMMNRETFMKNIQALDMLKLRFGFGITGNLPNDPYMSLIKYGTGAGTWDAINKQWVSATYGPSNNPNPNLKWEKNASCNWGLDFSLFNNRLSGIIDVYQRTTEGLIGEYTAQQPSLIYNSFLTNVGTMKNAGVELSLKGEPVKGKHFSYSMDFTLSYEKNKLTSLSNDLYKSSYESRYELPSPGNIGFAQRLQEGQPVGSFFGYKCDGISTDGKWIIRNLDGVESLSESDKTFIGNGLPSVKASILNSFVYKHIDFSFYLTGMFGFDILNESRIFMGTTSGIDKTGTNVYREALQYRLTEDPVFSTFFLEKGDFIKLESITLGYTFKNIKPAYIRNLRIHADVSNVYTWTRYTGLSPEVNVTGLEAGIDKRGMYPSTMTFMLGMSINF